MVLECLDMQTDAISSLYALNVAISPVACWFGFVFNFLHVTFILLYTVPDAWRLWVGPALG